MTLRQWKKINDYEKFTAINEKGERVRLMKESDETVFEYAKGRKKYGYRYNINMILSKYTLKGETLTEGDKWKKRLKKAIALCKKNDLWHNLREIWENLHDYVSLEEKRRICDEYWACDRYDKEKGRQNYADFINRVKTKYPFMIKTDEKGDEHIITGYIRELSDCRLKSMYFGKSRNAETKKEIARRIAEKQNYIFETTVNYDVSFSYDATKKKAWYSEEYRNCGNGHYYLAIGDSTAVFCEND